LYEAFPVSYLRKYLLYTVFVTKSHTALSLEAFDILKADLGDRISWFEPVIRWKVEHPPVGKNDNAPFDMVDPCAGCELLHCGEGG
jgi:hypothetical protein